jgi:hypothetical protein
MIANQWETDNTLRKQYIYTNETNASLFSFLLHVENYDLRFLRNFIKRYVICTKSSAYFSSFLLLVPHAHLPFHNSTAFCCTNMVLIVLYNCFTILNLKVKALWSKRTLLFKRFFLLCIRVLYMPTVICGCNELIVPWDARVRTSSFQFRTLIYIQAPCTSSVCSRVQSHRYICVQLFFEGQELYPNKWNNVCVFCSFFMVL